MRAENFEVQELIDALQGTCSSVDEQLELLYPDSDMTIYDLTDDDWDLINNDIFCCENCGWWCEACDISERDDEQSICNDCDEDNSD